MIALHYDKHHFNSFKKNLDSLYDNDDDYYYFEAWKILLRWMLREEMTLEIDEIMINLYCY